MTSEKPPDSQGFWTVAIGVPVLLSVLRLWVEAGGELQTTLLLVEHIDPINLIAALVATASWLVAAFFVAALAIGGVLNASVPGGRFRLARWTMRTPGWVRFGAFALAAITWEVIYLPLLVLAACAAFQLMPRGRWSLLVPVALAAYVALLWPTLRDAWNLSLQARTMALLLLIGPLVLAIFVAGPLRPWLVRPWAWVTQLLAFVLFLWLAVPLVTTPILPLTVTVTNPAQSGEAPGYLRGFVITSDNVNTVILGEDGEVNYVPNTLIQTQHLCPSDEEIPRYRLHLRLLFFSNVEPVSLEHSVLRGLGQANRGAPSASPACRVPAD